jgi:hypothetical protein
MPTRTQAHEGGTNVTIHIGKQFLILHLKYAFYNALLQRPCQRGETKPGQPVHVDFNNIFRVCHHHQQSLFLFLFFSAAEGDITTEREYTTAPSNGAQSLPALLQPNEEKL